MEIFSLLFLIFPPQSLLPSPPSEAPYSLEDVVQYFLKTDPTDRRLLGIKEGRDIDRSSGEENL